VTGPWIAAFVALSALVFVLTLLVLGTFRRITPLLERTEARLAAAPARQSGLPQGTAVPPFVAADSTGQTFTDADLRGSRTLVLFLGSGCQACDRFVGDLRAGLAPDIGARLIVIAEDPAEACDLAASGVPVLVQEEHSLSRVFESDRIPHAFVLDEEATVIASSWPNDWEGLRNLLSETTKGGGRDQDVAAALAAT
jgi:AhpC/TSA family